MKLDMEAFLDKFLNKKNIKELLLKNDLDALYAEFYWESHTILSTNLTNFFISNGIEPLKYFEYCIPYQYNTRGKYYIDLDLTNFRNITDISKSAFRNSCIRTFSGSPSLERLDELCFAECYSLRSVNLNMCENMESLPPGCFQFCNNLDTIFLPPNLKYIGIAALAQTTIGCYYIRRSDSAKELIAKYGDKYDITLF